MVTEKQIKDARTALDDLRDLRNSPKYVALLAERQRLDVALGEAAREYEEQVRAERTALESDLVALKRQRAVEKNPHLQFSVSLMSWFTKFVGAANFGYGDTLIRWVSPNQNWVIFTTEGTKAGGGTAMGSGAVYYAQATHYLMRVMEGTDFNNALRHNLQAFTAEGRLTKALKAAWTAHALALDEGTPFQLNADRSNYFGLRIGDYVKNHHKGTLGYISRLWDAGDEMKIEYKTEPRDFGITYTGISKITGTFELLHTVESFDYHNTFEVSDVEL